MNGFMKSKLKAITDFVIHESLYQVSSYMVFDFEWADQGDLGVRGGLVFSSRGWGGFTTRCLWWRWCREGGRAVSQLTLAPMVCRHWRLSQRRSISSISNCHLAPCFYINFKKAPDSFQFSNKVSRGQKYHPRSHIIHNSSFMDNPPYFHFNFPPFSGNAIISIVLGIKELKI